MEAETSWKTFTCRWHVGRSERRLGCLQELVWAGRLEHYQLLLQVSGHIHRHQRSQFVSSLEITEKNFVATLAGMQICVALVFYSGVTLETFAIDWLHCMDLGMAADFAGNLLFHALPQFPGKDMKHQRKALHRHLQFERRMPGASSLPPSSGLVLEK